MSKSPEHKFLRHMLGLDIAPAPYRNYYMAPYHMEGKRFQTMLGRMILDGLIVCHRAAPDYVQYCATWKGIREVWLGDIDKEIFIAEGI